MVLFRTPHCSQNKVQNCVKCIICKIPFTMYCWSPNKPIRRFISHIQLSLFCKQASKQIHTPYWLIHGGYILYILKNNALQPLFQARTHGSPSANTIFDFVFGRMGWFWKEPFGIVLTVNSTHGTMFSVQCSSVFVHYYSLLQ